MRGGDNDGVAKLGSNQLLRAAENLQSARSVAFKLARRSAANGHQLASRNLPIEQVSGVMLADVAHSDYSNPHLVHGPRTLADRATRANAEVEPATMDVLAKWT